MITKAGPPTDHLKGTHWLKHTLDFIATYFADENMLSGRMKSPRT